MEDRLTIIPDGVGGDHLMTANEWLDRGVTQSAKGLHDAARLAFIEALALDPSLAQADLGLGLSYMALQRFDDAVQPFRRAIAAPDAQASWFVCLGQALYMNGDFANSAEAFARAGAVEPLSDAARLTHARAAGLAALIDGSIDQALLIYDVLAGDGVEPLDKVMWDAFRTLNLFGYQEAALAVGRWRLDRNPADDVQAYMLDVAAGATIDQAPVAYLQAYFDEFADTFDEHLVNRLSYRVPEQLAKLVTDHRRGFATILDLGCGTGLAAPALIQLGGRLVGVDVSQAMLDKAQERACYDLLVQHEAVAFLRSQPHAFDLIFAADVLIYFGDLRALMAAAADALAPGGLLAISTESGPADWALLRSGRFSHADAYVDAMAKPSLTILQRQDVILRQEGAKPVLGVLSVFERM